MAVQHRSPVMFVLAALVVGACSTSTSDDERVGQVHQAIVGGAPSDDAQDDTVMLYHLDPSGPRLGGICTATLIAPKLVLTARHCVAFTDDQVGCDSDGTPLVGAGVKASFNPSDLYVFTGKDRPAFAGDQPPALDPTKWKPAGHGAEILDDKSGTLCNHDLALVLLENPIENVPIAALRLDGDVTPGEKLLTVGWGVTLAEAEPATRQQRANVSVKRVGPSDAIPVLTKSEFLFDESICLGDSGGPIFSQKTNAVVGVVSRGGNGSDPSQGGPSSTCTNADNVGTKVPAFKELITNAFQRAGAQPKFEVQPEEPSCAVVRPIPSDRSTAMPLLMITLVVALGRFRRRSSR